MRTCNCPFIILYQTKERSNGYRKNTATKLHLNIHFLKGKFKKKIQEERMKTQEKQHNSTKTPSVISSHA